MKICLHLWTLIKVVFMWRHCCNVGGQKQNLPLAPFIHPPALIVHWCIVICVSRDGLQSTYYFKRVWSHRFDNVMCACAKNAKKCLFRLKVIASILYLVHGRVRMQWIFFFFLSMVLWRWTIGASYLTCYSLQHLRA